VLNTAENRAGQAGAFWRAPTVTRARRDICPRLAAVLWPVAGGGGRGGQGSELGTIGVDLPDVGHPVRVGRVAAIELAAGLEDDSGPVRRPLRGSTAGEAGGGVSQSSEPSAIGVHPPDVGRPIPVARVAAIELAAGLEDDSGPVRRPLRGKTEGAGGSRVGQGCEPSAVRVDPLLATNVIHQRCLWWQHEPLFACWRQNRHIPSTKGARRL